MQVFVHLVKQTTLMDRIGNSIITILYAKYLVKMRHMVWLWNKKCSETRPKQCCSGSE